MNAFWCGPFFVYLSISLPLLHIFYFLFHSENYHFGNIFTPCYASIHLYPSVSFYFKFIFFLLFIIFVNLYFFQIPSFISFFLFFYLSFFFIPQEEPTAIIHSPFHLNTLTFFFFFPQSSLPTWTQWQGLNMHAHSRRLQR